MKCINSVNVDSFGCQKPCAGLIVPSFYKSEQKKTLENIFPILDAYNRFKTIVGAGLDKFKENKFFWWRNIVSYWK